jgi:hypothetical protein
MAAAPRSATGIGMLSASQEPNYARHRRPQRRSPTRRGTVKRLPYGRRREGGAGGGQRLARELRLPALFRIALGAGAARRRLEIDPARVKTITTSCRLPGGHGDAER